VLLEAWTSSQREKCRLRVDHETLEILEACLKDLLDGGSSAVPATYPDEFRWTAVEEAQLPEVRVLGDDCESMLLCIFPNDCVVDSFETDLPNVDGTREKISQ
jgi:hypothetical protein